VALSNTVQHPVSRQPALVGRRFYLLLTLCFFAMTAAFYVRASAIPPIGDSIGYMAMAKDISIIGVMAVHRMSDIRTIGYPTFIALVAKCPLPLEPAQTVVLAQAVLYWLVASLLLGLSRGLLAYRRSRRLLGVGLFLNPLPALYCSEILTEGLSLVALAACMTVILALARNRRKPARRVYLLFSLGLIAGLALIVRPANLGLVLASLACTAIPPLFSHAPLMRRLIDSAAGLLPVLVGVYIAASPQIASNWKYYDKATPLPTFELGKFQVHEGIQILKYGTLATAPVLRIWIVNPFVEKTVVRNDDGFEWYQRNPGRGLLTMAGHVFATLVQDPLYCYVVDLKPWYLPLVILINAFVVVVGLGGLLGLSWRHRRSAVSMPAAWFVLATLGASMAIAAISAAESRFGLQTLSIAFVAACLAVGRASQLRSRPGLLVAGIAASLVFIFLALKLGDLAIVLPPHH